MAEEIKNSKSRKNSNKKPRKEVAKISAEKQVELVLENVSKTYKLENKQTFQALYDLNATFYKGELVSIVGESGSGKSTLMNLIGGLDSDFSGTITSCGQNLHSLKDRQLDNYRKNNVGFVFQSFNLISHLSILDNVTLALTLSNVGEREKVQRATRILQRVGLSEHLKKKPTQLSGGQKQRVAIARALINNPSIIIADEPTGALDSQTSMQILQILKEIADSGKLVIMVTHSEKVASVSSRVVEISDGRIISDRTNPRYKKTNVPPINSQVYDQAPAAQENGSALENETSANETSAKEKVAAEKVRNFSTKENTSSLGNSSAQENISTQENLLQQNSLQENNVSKNTKPEKRSFGKRLKGKNLSLYSAIRLSFHNMWASKTKNFLMAIGVAIGIGSLILMMCFSSGITDYIQTTMNSYADPTIVTISKGGDIMTAMSDPLFSEDEKLLIQSTLNDRLREEFGEDAFQIDYTPETGNVTYGIQMMTMTLQANVIYNPDSLEVDYFSNLALKQSELEYQSILCVYTIPPYYTSNNVIEGELSTNEGGIMFTSAIKNMFEDGDWQIEDENGTKTGKKVDVAFMYNGKKYEFKQQQITGIMDVSVMGGMNIMYVDYNYFQKIFAEQEQSGGKALDPNVLYIRTPSKEVTDFINHELATNEALEGFSGSIEQSLGTMFTSMTSVIGTSLTIISSISLLVSAMMILVVLYMSVSERTKEIGVLKSIGARRKDIKRIFTSESFLIGLLSGVFGIIFNLLLTLVIYLLLQNLVGFAPISYRWWYFAVAILVSVLISMLSGLYPASKAAKLDPVESLRRE